MINLPYVLGVLIILSFASVCFFGAPFVPTRRKWAKEALGMVKFGKDDLVVDLGSGSGTILKLLSKRGIKSVGYELNPLLWVISKIRFMFVNLVEVKLTNFWTQDLPEETSVVYVFAVTRDADRLVKYFNNQSKQRRFVVITFGLELPTKKNIKHTNGAFLYKF